MTIASKPLESIHICLEVDTRLATTKKLERKLARQTSSIL
jgi:hypothetical protein